MKSRSTLFIGAVGKYFDFPLSIRLVGVKTPGHPTKRAPIGTRDRTRQLVSCDGSAQSGRRIVRLEDVGPILERAGAAADDDDVADVGPLAVGVDSGKRGRLFKMKLWHCKDKSVKLWCICT